MSKEANSGLKKPHSLSRGVTLEKNPPGATGSWGASGDPEGSVGRTSGWRKRMGNLSGCRITRLTADCSLGGRFWTLGDRSLCPVPWESWETMLRPKKDGSGVSPSMPSAEVEITGLGWALPHAASDHGFILFYFLKICIVIQLQLSAFSPHPSHSFKRKQEKADRPG